MPSKKSIQLIYILISLSYFSCQKKAPNIHILTFTDEEAAELAEKTENNALVTNGLKLTLWASDSLAPDPISMSIDDFGRVYISSTNRRRSSAIDIRGHQDWMTPSISFQSVKDRREFMMDVLSTDKSNENSWLTDFNRDSIHDWKDLTVQKEEVWLIEDVSGDGLADRASQIINDFHEIETETAGAILVHENNLFVGVAPDMWRFTDQNNDGIPEEKTSISHGWAVHIGFGGHGMSGATIGPDGKLYWGMGDYGINLVDNDGDTVSFPNEGVIVRSNFDGSDFEVFASGLRNTHEFVFDDYGNLITSDNDGDHPGESERLVYLIDGSDSGWRINWQFGKYTDPKNNDYKVWMDEELYKPKWDGQAAYILPPIINYHNGPAGMVYNPGTALGSRWLNTFFLVEFVGTPARSKIWSFQLSAEGAGFKLKKEEEILRGILPTGIRFGPDGALYIADWINGWETKDLGKIWKLDVLGQEADLQSERNQTQAYIRDNFQKLSDEELIQRLGYPDQRVRQKAQFELARRGEESITKLKEALHPGQNQLTRIHAIWALGQIAQENISVLDELLVLINDRDPEIIAQTLKVLGDHEYSKVGSAIIPLINHEHPRIRLFATQAVGKMRLQNAPASIFEMINNNQGRDVYLRTAAGIALARIGNIPAITSVINHLSVHVRLVAVVALRRLRNPAVKNFLNDSNELVVTEAARAINDDLSIAEALPDLAYIVSNDSFTSEALIRRALNAALRVGTAECIELLIDYALNKKAPIELREEAISCLSTWYAPSVHDRVDGRYRGVIKRDPNSIIPQIDAVMNSLLDDTEPAIVKSAYQLIRNYQLDQYSNILLAHFYSKGGEQTRSEALETLAFLGYSNISVLINEALSSRKVKLRTSALGLIPQIDLNTNELQKLIKTVFETGSIKEQQEIIKVLKEFDPGEIKPVLFELAIKFSNGELPSEIHLELEEAIDSNLYPVLYQSLNNEKGEYASTLYGGDKDRGRRIFMRNDNAQCVRCHSVGGTGGIVGPPLDQIGIELNREGIMKALITPNERIAPGYGVTMITLKNEDVVSGVLKAEAEDEIILESGSEKQIKIAKNEISKREDAPSGMPAMGTLLSKREIRDLVEFLASQTNKFKGSDL